MNDILNKDIREMEVSAIEQDNSLFQIIHNKEKDCYDMIFKKESYNTTADLLGICSWLHQLGVNEPKLKLRIGAMVEKGGLAR